MKKITIAAALATMLCGSIQAGDLDLMVGKNFFDSDANLEDTLAYGLRYNHNYQNSPWGTQIGYERINGADIDIAGVVGDIDADRFFANMLYDFYEEGKLKTFLLGGFGYEDVDSNFASLDSQLFVDLGVGLRYMLSEQLSLVAEAKYIRKLEDNMNDFTTSIGIGYRFGEAAVKKAPQAEPVPVVASTTPSYHIEPKPAPKPVVREVPKDSDGDGVMDNFDMCPNTFSSTQVDKNGCPVMMELHVNFDFNKYNVKSVYQNQIDKAVRAMKIMPWVSATVVGHTDSIGSDGYNQKLSERRANAVKQAMIKSGNLKADRITALGKGEKEPIATNKTDEGRAENRRVEVYFE
jgi:OOP family OmpA-OmpF porin